MAWRVSGRRGSPPKLAEVSACDATVSVARIRTPPSWSGRTPDAALPLESVPATCACLAGTCSPTKKACDTQGGTPPLASLAERTYDDSYNISDSADSVKSITCTFHLLYLCQTRMVSAG